MKAPTLADLAYRETFRRDRLIPQHQRETLANMRRFVLDKDMSEFLDPLSLEAFKGKVKPKRQFEIVESLRRSARPPHRITWIEYDSHARRRVAQKRNPLLAGTDEIAPRTGWIIEEHQDQPGSICATIIIEDKGRAVALPFSWLWQTDDTLDEFAAWENGEGRIQMHVGNKQLDIDQSAECATGIGGYRSKRVKVLSSWLAKHPQKEKEFYHLLTEWNGELRTIWALLSTINDLPVGSMYMPPQGGFVARGNYRKFLDHTTIHLKIPAKRTISQVAKTAVLAARKRAHEVRGHWRVFLWGAVVPCRDTAHIWQEDNACVCGAKRTWVHEHQRGDASLGFVTHDYSIEKGTPP